MLLLQIEFHLPPNGLVHDNWLYHASLQARADAGAGGSGWWHDRRGLCIDCKCNARQKRV